MFSLQPSIDPAISELAPGFRALSIGVQATTIKNPKSAAEALDQACRALKNAKAEWAEPHFAAWAEVFTRFGAKPKRTPCSAEALHKRALKDGKISSIDPIVDLYNAISIQFAVPVGGENIDAYAGNPRLTVANGTELFDTVKDGQMAEESPDAGEVIWRDDIGVTCRRWNWRQGLRTRLNSEAKNMWFILESLPEMPLQSLLDAGDQLIIGLNRLMPGATTERQLIEIKSS
jgi:DNA/RNA-binding domain of Phe-tRNA-synthetase-like protein